MRAKTVAQLTVAVASLIGHDLPAQADHFNAALLPAVRRAATFIPGEAPTSVNFVLLNPFTVTWSFLLEGGNRDSVAGGYPVFQIRFPRGWITVDAALDRSFVPNSKTWDDSTYRAIHEALRRARLSVITHEQIGRAHV